MALPCQTAASPQHVEHLRGALQGHGGIQMPYSDDRKWTVRQHLLDVVQVRTAGSWRYDLLNRATSTCVYTPRVRCALADLPCHVPSALCISSTAACARQRCLPPALSLGHQQQ